LSTPTQTAPPAEHHEDTVPLPRPLKRKIKDGIVAVSLANLCFIGVWYRLFSNLGLGFFNSIPINQATLLAMLVNISWLAAVFWLVLRAWHRWQNQWFHLLVHLLFLGVLLMTVLVRIQMHTEHSLISLLQQPAGVFVAVVIGALILWKHRLIARIATIVVAILSPLAVYPLAKIILLSFGIIIHSPVQPGLFHPVPPGPVREGRPRVVWIIFDEADYRMIFDQRPAGLELPEFDHLRGESLSANNANSPAGSTITSMPSLIFGYRVSKAILTNSSDLAVQFVITNGTYWCSRQPSVFSSAREMGVNTAVVGWALPYSKLFGKDLNYCSWRPFPIYQRARGSTFGDAMWRQIRGLTGPLQVRQDVVTLYQQSLAESTSLVTNQTYGLILLHMFPPHFPGIYLRDKNQFTARKMDTATGYFNNLALADRTLGKLRQVMETSAEWETTWFIVSADHSWRYSREYDGQHDYRVPFLVNPPGPNEPVVYSQPFNTVATHDLILAILRGEITNRTQAVADWLQAHAPAKATVEGQLIVPQ
jgi:hypothetical protein